MLRILCVQHLCLCDEMSYFILCVHAAICRSLLPSAGLPLAHHSATLVGSSIVVYGGRSTGTDDETKGACYRDDVLVYDIGVFVWCVWYVYIRTYVCTCMFMW